MVNWETSDLRKWLNNDFYNSAFSDSEKNLIASTTLDNEDNYQYNVTGGNTTQDKIFCLSLTECLKYFDNDKSRSCAPSKYTKDQGATTDDLGNCYWWLRSPGQESGSVATISPTSGTILNSGMGCHEQHNSVRPAMWISISDKELPNLVFSADESKLKELKENKKTLETRVQNNMVEKLPISIFGLFIVIIATITTIAILIYETISLVNNQKENFYNSYRQNYDYNDNTSSYSRSNTYNNNNSYQTDYSSSNNSQSVDNTWSNQNSWPENNTSSYDSSLSQNYDESLKSNYNGEMLSDYYDMPKFSGIKDLPFDTAEYKLKSMLNFDDDGSVSVVLGRLYYNGKNSVRDFYNAFQNYKVAALKGNGLGMFLYAQMLYNGQYQKDDDNAFYWYLRSAEANSPDGIEAMGILYRDTKIVKQNFDQAFNYFKRCESLNSGSCLFNLGLAYENGQGTPQNLRKACELFEKSTKKEYKLAYVKYGDCLLASKNHYDARREYEKGARRNASRAMYRMGITSLLGLGTPANTQEAIEWLDKAAPRNGNAAAALALYLLC